MLIVALVMNNSLLDGVRAAGLLELRQYNYVVSIDPGIRYFAYVTIDVSGRCIHKWRMQPLLTEARDKNKAPDDNEKRLIVQRLMVMASGIVPITDYTKVLVLVEPWLKYQPSMRFLYKGILSNILKRQIEGHTYLETRGARDIIDTYLEDVQRADASRKIKGSSKAQRKRFVFEHVLSRLPRKMRMNYTLAEHKDDLADALLQFLAHFYLDPSWFRLPVQPQAANDVIELVGDIEENSQRPQKQARTGAV